MDDLQNPGRKRARMECAFGHLTVTDGPHHEPRPEDLAAPGRPGSFGTQLPRFLNAQGSETMRSAAPRMRREGEPSIGNAAPSQPTVIVKKRARLITPV